MEKQVFDFKGVKDETPKATLQLVAKDDLLRESIIGETLVSAVAKGHVIGMKECKTIVPISTVNPEKTKKWFAESGKGQGYTQVGKEYHGPKLRFITVDGKYVQLSKTLQDMSYTDMLTNLGQKAGSDGKRRCKVRFHHFGVTKDVNGTRVPVFQTRKNQATGEIVPVLDEHGEKIQAVCLRVSMNGEGIRNEERDLAEILQADGITLG